VGEVGGGGAWCRYRRAGSRYRDSAALGSLGHELTAGGLAAKDCDTGVGLFSHSVREEHR